MKWIKNFINNYWSLILIILSPIGFVILMDFLNWPNTKQQVHWHMPISYDLCWNTTQLKDDWQHWKIHWHNDNQAHVEWIIDTENRKETLWVFFDSANIKFSQTQIWKYKNWDKCKWSSKKWKVSVIINWKTNLEFRNYILNDKDKIKVIFN